MVASMAPHRAVVGAWGLPGRGLTQNSCDVLVLDMGEVSLMWLLRGLLHEVAVHITPC